MDKGTDSYRELKDLDRKVLPPNLKIKNQTSDGALGKARVQIIKMYENKMRV